MNPLRRHEQIIKKQTIPAKKGKFTQKQLGQLGEKSVEQNANTELSPGSAVEGSAAGGGSSVAGSLGGVAAGAVATVAVVAAASVGLVDIAGLDMDIFLPESPPPPMYSAVIDRVDFTRTGDRLYILPFAEESNYFGKMLAELYSGNDEAPIMSMEFGGTLSETMIIFDIEGLSGRHELIISGHSNDSAQEKKDEQTSESIILYRAIINL